MIEVAFWSAVALVVYVYAGYPACAWVLAHLHRRPVHKDDFTPPVTIIIAAYNEEKYIGSTIENKLGLDYPRDHLQIIVVSDESSDQTDAIVNRFVDETQGVVRLLRQSPRGGKTSALNMAIREATGEIIVFSDANSIYEAGALRALMRNFCDPEVGYVTGKMVYAAADGSIVGDGCSAFMRYENYLRALETNLGSVVGVDGGVDAVRKNLYRDMRADQLPDFVLPLSVAKRGYRVVYEPAALLKEEALAEGKDEYRMRVRVALRAFWALYDMRSLFNPLKYGIYSWQILSHKALRYMAFVPLLVIPLANIFLLWKGRGLVYQLTFLGFCLLCAFALWGRALARNGGGNALSAFAYYFALVNTASGHAFGKFLRGEKKVIWNPRTG